MPSSHSLAGLMKWLTREPWRDAFADVLEQHVAGPCEAAGIESIEELGERVGAHWATTLWGCAFEDFLTREVEGPATSSTTISSGAAGRRTPSTAPTWRPSDPRR